MRYPNFAFTVQKKSSSSRARRATITTPHGEVQTPAFIFCATKANIKSLPIEWVKENNTQIILSNTYHLMLQPGADIVEKLGGLHRFCGWNGPMFTDSGGYQIFSLGHGSVSDEVKGRRKSEGRKSLVKINEEGATFNSYINGTRYLLTPEISIDIQRKLGADLIVVLDECTPFHVEKDYTARSMRMSHRWALRSLAEFDRKNDGKQALYGIIQGGIYQDLRKESCDFVNENDFFAHAVGGSLGQNKAQMHDIVHNTVPMLCDGRPIHLLGIGGIQDIFNGVEAGIDTFDCVHPTRLARHGGALVKGLGAREHLNLNNAQFKEDTKPIDDSCNCQCCTGYSRGYLHHLLKAKEILAQTLITAHNIAFMNRLMQNIRNCLEHDGDLNALKKSYTE